MVKLAGESDSNSIKVFDEAEKNAPAIIFIDEIDSFLRSVGDEIFYQILTEMDGMGKKKSVFMVCATNRPDILLSAIMRDQLIYIPILILKQEFQFLNQLQENLQF